MERQDMLRDRLDDLERKTRAVEQDLAEAVVAFSETRNNVAELASSITRAREAVQKRAASHIVQVLVQRLRDLRQPASHIVQVLVQRLRDLRRRSVQRDLESMEEIALQIEKAVAEGTRGLLELQEKQSQIADGLVATR